MFRTFLETSPSPSTIPRNLLAFILCCVKPSARSSRQLPQQPVAKISKISRNFEGIWGKISTVFSFVFPFFLSASDSKRIAKRYFRIMKYSERIFEIPRRIFKNRESITRGNPSTFPSLPPLPSILYLPPFTLHSPPSSLLLIPLQKSALCSQ